MTIGGPRYEKINIYIFRSEFLQRRLSLLRSKFTFSDTLRYSLLTLLLLLLIENMDTIPFMLNPDSFEVFLGVFLTKIEGVDQTRDPVHSIKIDHFYLNT